MTGKRLHGIDEVLSNLISAQSDDTKIRSLPPEQGRTRGNTKPVAKKTRKANRSGARLGRPLARHSEPGNPKEKLTVRIPCKLAAEYRDWSWEARCSLSGLVEKAMADFRQRSIH